MSQKYCYGPGTIHATEKKRIPILLYHYVEYVKDRNDKLRQSMNIVPDIFESQVKNLVEHNYKTVFVRQIPEILKEPLPLCEKSVALSFDDGYEDFYTHVFPILKKYNARATVYIVHNFIGKPNFMNEDQIAELIESGLVEIGSHTFDHVDLSLLSEEQSRYQIVESKKALEKRFHVPIRTFAYPYGKYKGSDINLVKEASYAGAVTVAQGTLHTEAEKYVLTRERPENFIGFDLGVSLEQSAQ